MVSPLGALSAPLMRSDPEPQVGSYTVWRRLVSGELKPKQAQLRKEEGTRSRTIGYPIETPENIRDHAETIQTRVERLL